MALFLLEEYKKFRIVYKKGSLSYTNTKQKRSMVWIIFGVSM